MPSTSRPMPEVDRRAATEAGIRARRARAAIKHSVTSGSRSAFDVFAVAKADRTSAEATLRVSDFLTSIRGIGVGKAEAIMDTLGISPRKRLGALGRLQRESLRSWLIERERDSLVATTPRVLVLVGPTAVGKGTVATRVRQLRPDLVISVSATTRAPRPGEVDGLSYYFVDQAEFDAMQADGALLEWAVVHGLHKYGTPRRPIELALEQGRSVLLEIDIQGARQIKQSMPEARIVFLLPPSWDELVRRLTGRGTEDAAEQQRRLDTAVGELAAQDEFDVRTINDSVDETARQVVDLIGITEE
jgi:guanylate kinase